MEKKRRARINNCLTQLKTLVLQAMRKDVSLINSLLYHYYTIAFFALINLISHNSVGI